MRLPQIRLESSFAQIGIQSGRGKQSIEQPKTNIDIQQPKAEMTIERTPSKLSIDQTQAWEDMDLKHIFRRIEEFAMNGHRDAQAGTARRAEEGSEMMRIENGGSVLADISERNGKRADYEFKLGFIPSPFSVKIDYVPTKLDINWQVNRPIIHSQPQKPITEYEPVTVDISLDRHATLDIDFAHLTFKGIHYEQEI